MADLLDLEVPSRRYGHYVLRSRLGVGGMSEVFLAEAVDPDGQQVSVALKLMKQEVTDAEFAGEADLMGLLDHFNLVRRLEVGKAFGRPFIAMEFLIGGDLRNLVTACQQQGAPMPLSVALHIVLEALQALAYFHQAKSREGKPLGLVHGDVSPANIFFSGTGTVKLGDYGVAHKQAAAVGKLYYQSPEQTRGDRLTPASDLYSLGLVMFELMTGEHPFKEAKDAHQFVQALRQSKLRIPKTVDKDLALILRQALSPELKDRYPSAGHFAGDLFRCVLNQGHRMAENDFRLWLAQTLGLMF